jgi:hypothetical protein
VLCPALRCHSIGLKTVIEAASSNLAPALAALVSGRMTTGAQQKVRSQRGAGVAQGHAGGGGQPGGHSRQWSRGQCAGGGEAGAGRGAVGSEMLFHPQLV